MQYSRNLGLNSGIELEKLINYTDVEKENDIQTAFQLNQNYSNPFNPVTTITYSLPVASNVTLKIFDASGREVTTLENKYRNAGTYKIDFDAKQLASGIYFYRIEAGKYVSTRKLVLVK